MAEGVSDDTQPVRGPQRRQRRWRAYVPAFGVVAVIGGGALVAQVVAPASDEVQAADTGDVVATPAMIDDATATLVVRDGDRVVAEGHLVDAADGLVLCRLEPDQREVADGAARVPVCSGVAVEVEGLDDVDVPSWVETDGEPSGVLGYSARSLVVTGSWTGDALRVEAVAQAAVRTGDDRRSGIPCDEPAGGWRAGTGLGDLSTADVAAQRRALDQVVAADPARFAEVTSVTVTLGTQPVVVTLVGTISDPDAAGAELAAHYAGNLCVYGIDHSAAELVAAAERLEQPDGTWHGEPLVDPVAGSYRLALGLPVLDHEALDLIGADLDLVELDPLVRRG